LESIKTLEKLSLDTKTWLVDYIFKESSHFKQYFNPELSTEENIKIIDAGEQIVAMDEELDKLKKELEKLQNLTDATWEKKFMSDIERKKKRNLECIEECKRRRDIRDRTYADLKLMQTNPLLSEQTNLILSIALEQLNSTDLTCKPELIKHFQTIEQFKVNLINELKANVAKLEGDIKEKKNRRVQVLNTFNIVMKDLNENLS